MSPWVWFNVPRKKLRPIWLLGHSAIILGKNWRGDNIFSTMETTSELVTQPSQPNQDNERLLFRFGASRANVAADAAGHPEPTLLVKRTIWVGDSSSTKSVPPARRGGSKRQKSSSGPNGPLLLLCNRCLLLLAHLKAGAGRPCHSWDPGECNRCWVQCVSQRPDRVLPQTSSKEGRDAAARCKTGH